MATFNITPQGVGKDGRSGPCDWQWGQRARSGLETGTVSSCEAGSGRSRKCWNSKRWENL
ncbi:hypothetical protein JRQ81_020054 [Phrynocephalus forsythii]|uniref:Uncharacterized protein n=1 Tax=Phrynocephalus forsythii TaxID=171643 RepID=A0A9Q1AYW4_9SAUR|nr:hypothetical protein JRQ81_020054 [Phrynocephalus forsythii]